MTNFFKLSLRCFLGLWVIGSLGVLGAEASALDDKIEQFKNSDKQTEVQVAWILKTGLEEDRGTEALVAVRPWLSANTARSQSLLFYAGRAMHYSGDWSDAVVFYRKLLKSSSIDANLAAAVVPATYRLLINDMRDPDAAYLFMRQDGNRLRKYGRAKQFDRWFMREAVRRRDVRALAERLAAIHSSPNEHPDEYAAFMDALYKELETFEVRDEATVEALDNLARVATREPGFKARWDWIHAVSKYNAEALKTNIKSQEPAKELLEEPLKAARALIAVDPIPGAALIARGFSQWNQGDTPTFFRFVHVHKELKGKVFVDALARLSPVDAKKMLNAGANGPRGRWVSVVGFLSRKQLQSVVPRYSDVFNAIDSPATPLWEKDITVEQAKALAPHISNNAHPDAALVRAYAATGSKKVADLVPAMMKSERWRFGHDKKYSNAKRIVDLAWNSGADRNGADFKKLVKQFENMGARYDRIKKQIGKDADNRSRNEAFTELYKEIVGPNPSTPALLSLWSELFQEAPSEDKVKMLTRLTSDYHTALMALSKPVPPGQPKPGSDQAMLRKRDELEFLLRRAVANSMFGKKNRYAILRWRLDEKQHDYHNWTAYGKRDLRKELVQYAKSLETMLRQQIKQNILSAPIFSLWLSCVEPDTKEAKTLMNEIKKAPAYAYLDRACQETAANDDLFGQGALTEKSLTDPRVVSRELIQLPKDAAPAQVEAAFRAVMTRVANAPEPVKVIGLHKVAALPKIEGATRKLALALFSSLSPLGEYPSRQGYEQLALRLVKEMRESGQWGQIVPYAAGLWRAAGSPDDNRSDHNNHHVSAALTSFAEAALEAESFSTALALARCGVRSGVPREDRRGRLNAVVGKASVAMGVVEIKTDTSDPAYEIHKSSSEFVKGNLDSAWKLYIENDQLLMPKEDAPDAKPLLRKLPVEYSFWLIKENIAKGRREQAEQLVKDLTIWSRQEAGILSLEQEAELKITLADLAFLKGALPTARAWYRKVADAREYQGSDVHVRAALGSVKVDRVSKNFSAALEELDKLMRINNPSVRAQVRYAKAEVLMDQENYKDAYEELEAVLRGDENNEDAKILRGKVEIYMRRLVEASEIELGVSREDKVMVPGEVLKINLLDPTLSISGVGADIEVEVWAKSGDRERVMLHQLGDNKERFRADVPTELAPPVKGDKTLQVLGVDEIRYGYSQRFRAKMKDLPPDPKTVITIASDAYLSFSAGAFPPRKGERKLSVDELGLSSAQAKLGTRMVRPGNPVYVRVIDPDQSKTAGIDEIPVTLETSSGDVIRRMLLHETGPFTGEFQAVIPTAGAQASAFASEMAPGRDPNMAISAKDYPGWLGKVGDKDAARMFGVDFNDNVPFDKMKVMWLAANEPITHFVLQTSLNGRDWVTRARYPKDEAPWNGRPRVTSFPTYRGGIVVSPKRSRGLPPDWKEKMELSSARASCGYLAAYVPSLSAEKLPLVNTGHPSYSGLMRYRALFYQKDMAVRRFSLTGYPPEKTVFLIDGTPADEESEDPMLIEREIRPGLHEVEVWYDDGRDIIEKSKPVLLCDVRGKTELQPCPDSMFDPKTFPEGVQAQIPQPASVTNFPGGVEVKFGGTTQARLVRLSIQGFKGVAPGIKKVTLTGRDGKAYLPVQQDFMALRQNFQLEVLPGDTVVARYEDPVSATPKRTRHEGRLGVAFNTAQISASFLNYETTVEGRRLLLEPIRRFNLEDAVAIVVDDVDMDSTPKRDVVEFTAITSDGRKTNLKAVETEEHSGRFVGRIFPVTGKPQRESELQVPEGGTLTLIYRDMENLDPGIPTDRKVTIEHAKYMTPKLGAYTVRSEWTAPAVRPLEEGVTSAVKKTQEKHSRASGPETVIPRRNISYNYVGQSKLPNTKLEALIGGSLKFDVVATHLALAQSSEVSAYVQVASPGSLSKPFDVTAPGTLKLTANPSSGGGGAVPQGYESTDGSGNEASGSALDEGRFAFSVPLMLGDKPQSSFATEAAQESGAEMPEGLIVKAGDVVRIGYAWKDENDKVQWKTASVTVGSHAFMDVMAGNYSDQLYRVFVGERIFLRVLAPGLDVGPDRDWTSVNLKATSGAQAEFKLRETLAHSGVFKGVFTVSYAVEDLPAQLPPVELNGFPVRYGDAIEVTYPAAGEDPEQKASVAINMGADGGIEPFSKRFTGDEMAVRTSFTLSECFFELAKKHRKMDQESLARREMAHAKKLLQEAIATHRDDNLRANAEYLLGNLAQEYADLSKNEESKLPMYQDALARFSKIPTDYPDTEFANKAQFKTGLVYEKMKENEIAVEEYVKLAYKYPHSEYIPEVMSRLGKYFQANGQKYKEQADPLRDKEDVDSKSEVIRLDELSYPEFLKAATIYGKLFERFPDHKLAGLAGLASAQNLMRAHQYADAVERFAKVVEVEEYDDNNIRAQALYWSGLSYERLAAISRRSDDHQEAYETYRRLTFDFPDSIWAKRARGRIADPTFAKIIELEDQKREAMLDAIKYQKIKRQQDKQQKGLMDKLLKR